MSLGSGYCQQFVADMIEMGLEHDIVGIGSAGNDYSGFASFPGSFTGVIRVGSTDFLDRRVAHSNYGPDLSVVAPGYNILSTSYSSDTATSNQSGTSMAAPHVTGLAAYMLTFNPDLKPDQIKTYLEKNADPVEGQKGFDLHVGWGRINTYRTIGAVIADMGANRTPASDYVNSPVKVTVTAGGAPLNNVNVWLYNCNQTGTISNYVAVSLTGDSFVDLRDDLYLEPELGVARFNLLKPGFYRVTAATLFADLDNGVNAPVVTSSPMFEVRAGSAVQPIMLVFDAELMVIQTLASKGNTIDTDTVISLYNTETGNALLTDYDGSRFESLPLIKPKKPGTYWIRIRAWNGSTDNAGEYALWVGDSVIDSPAPGTYAAPGDNGVQSISAPNRGAAQLIEVNGKVIYGNLTTVNRANGDYYKFVMPAS
jgi:hypothetical protein